MSTIETVNIILADGDNTLQIDSSFPGNVNLQGKGGDDEFVVSSTGTGLHPTNIGRAEYIVGTLNIDGGTGTDTVVVDDTGNSDGNTGTLDGLTVSGLGIDRLGEGLPRPRTFRTVENITVKLALAVTRSTRRLQSPV